MTVKRILRVLPFLLLALTATVANAQDDTLVLGRISDDPKAHYEQLKPLLDYVVPRMHDVGIRRGRILMARDVSQMSSYLRRGRVHWVTETAASGMLLRRRAGAVPLLWTNRGGVSQYRTLFFVRRDSGIETLEALRGRSIAFQNNTSASAYFVPAYELLQRGMKLELQLSPLMRAGNDVVGYVFARSERNIATWVVKGLTDAGVMSDLDWESAERMPPAYRAQMRVLHISQPFPRALELVSERLSSERRERLKAVLLEAQHDPAAAPALKAFFSTSGFGVMDEARMREFGYIEAAVTRVSREVE